MIPKLKEKQIAIKLRRRGFSYGEISKEILVAKSTLSLWLRNIGLTNEQKQRLTAKKLVAARLGGEARHRQRVLITDQIRKQAREQIGKLTKRELWLLGTSLYWAEGNKEKDKGALVRLSNSDSRLTKLFLKWLLGICNVSQSDIHFEIYVHETAQSRIKKIKRHWSIELNLPISNFQKIIWKKSKIFTKRKNIGEDYFGVLRIIVRKSINFNRKISGWVEGICQNL